MHSTQLNSSIASSFLIFRFTKTAILAMGLAIAGNANAEIFDFKYTFTGSSDVVTGTFSGTASGDVITNLSNITISFNGVAIPTDSTGSMYTGSVQLIGWANYGAQLSFDGLQNNAGFFDTNYPASPGTAYPNYGFVTYNNSTYGNYIEFGHTSTSNGQYTGTIFDVVNSEIPVYGYPAFNQAAWSVSAVPEAGEWAMMLLGLPLVGWVVRRKQYFLSTVVA